MDLSVRFDADITHKFSTKDRKGPWARVSTIRLDNAETLVNILSWCNTEFKSDDWAFQYRNNFATNEVIFYFNDLRDYTIFVLKYQQ